MQMSAVETRLSNFLQLYYSIIIIIIVITHNQYSELRETYLICVVLMFNCFHNNLTLIYSCLRRLMFV